MEEETYQSKSQQKNSTQSKRQQIKVQQYRTQPFQQPQQLQDSQDSIVQQFEQKIIGNKKLRIKQAQSKQSYQPKQNKQSKRSSLQSPDLEIYSKKNQAILQFKIKQLQKICTTLTSANQKLLDKIQELQQQNDKNKNLVKLLENQLQQQHEYKYTNNQKDRLNQSLYQKTESQKQIIENQYLQEQNAQSQIQLEQQVVDIQKMIKDYRQELKKSQQKNKIYKQTCQNNVALLEGQLNEMKGKLTEFELINQELQEQVMELQNRNQQLQIQISNMISNPGLSYQYYQQDIEDKRRTQSRSSQYQTPAQQQRKRPFYQNMRYNQNYNSYYDQEQYTHLNSSVQMQLEKLIQKLVKQLQLQRSIKMKMADQIKRIQKDLLQSQKQIMAKNKRIYFLQMSLLKGQKQYLLNGSNPLSKGSSKVVSNLQLNLQNSNSSVIKSNDIRQKIRQKYSHHHNAGKDLQRNDRRHVIFQRQQQMPVRQNGKYPNMNNKLGTSNVTKIPITPVPISAYNTNKNTNLNSNIINTSMSSLSNKQTQKLLQTFTLLQLVNEPSIILTISEKLHISLKLVGLYEQKIYVNKNYQLLMLQDILITNFNRINLRLIKVKVDVKRRLQTGAQSVTANNKKKAGNNIGQEGYEAGAPQKAIWNMGFLLNCLINDIQDKQRDFGKFDCQQKLLQQIQNLLDNRSLHKQVFENISVFINQALNQRSIK